MTKVLLADDHPIVLSGLKAILQGTAYDVVGSFEHGQTLLEALPKLKPDLLVLDINMPQRNGLDVLRTLRSRGDQMLVVFLTADLDDHALVESLRLGVNGIMLKDGAQDILIRCLDSICSGSRWIDRTLMERALEYTIETGSAQKAPLASLTLREKTVAGLVARGLRNRQIAEELRISEGTVKFYLHNIYEKLGIGNRTELAMVSRGTSAPLPIQR